MRIGCPFVGWELGVPRGGVDWDCCTPELEAPWCWDDSSHHSSPAEEERDDMTWWRPRGVSGSRPLSWEATGHCAVLPSLCVTGRVDTGPAGTVTLNSLATLGRISYPVRPSPRPGSFLCVWQEAFGLLLVLGSNARPGACLPRGIVFCFSLGWRLWVGYWYIEWQTSTGTVTEAWVPLHTGGTGFWVRTEKRPWKGLFTDWSREASHVHHVDGSFWAWKGSTVLMWLLSFFDSFSPPHDSLMPSLNWPEESVQWLFIGPAVYMGHFESILTYQM